MTAPNVKAKVVPVTNEPARWHHSNSQGYSRLGAELGYVFIAIEEEYTSTNVQLEDLRNAIKKVNLTSQLNDAPISTAVKDSAFNYLTKSAITFHEHQTVRQAKAPQQLNNRSRQALRDLRIAIDRVHSGAEGGDEAVEEE
ncbi:MAG: hypothetical protein ASARMPREDX12_009168 [Alectoria sarmentosa]|nr:MAG: hypothetical protein ASARMPREDX12_009168 [Alectoria sarmentosa]